MEKEQCLGLECRDHRMVPAGAGRCGGVCHGSDGPVQGEGGSTCRGPGSPHLPTFAGTISRSIPASFTSCTMVGESEPPRAKLCESCSWGKMADF